jgi:GNAT superfamily N-acetyltransferase
MSADLETTLAAYADYFSLGVNFEERNRALFVRREGTPHVWDANHVRLIRTPDSELDTLFDRADEHYAALPFRAFRVDPLTPPVLEARLLQADFRCQLDLLLTCEGTVTDRPCDVHFDPVLSDADWAAWWTLKQRDLADGGFLSLGDEWLAHVRSKCPPVRYWLARKGDQAVGFFSEFTSRGVGLLEDLYVDPPHRGRNVGAALVAHCAHQARERGAGPLIIPVKATDTPKQLYGKLGFRPSIPLRLYHKALEAGELAFD